MNNPFYLYAGTGAASPALTLGTDLPKTVDGLPAFYFWRQAIRDGKWVHPVKRWELSVTPDKREAWANKFNQMHAAKVDVPIRDTHDGARLGRIMAVRQSGDWYEELHQYAGEKARDKALAQKISVGIHPNFKDDGGKEWGEAIYESAIVPDPVVFDSGKAIAASIGQQDAVDVFQLAASIGDSSMEFIKRLRDTLGAANATEDEVVAQVTALFKNKTDTATIQASLTTAQTELTAAKGRLEAADAKVLQLSTGGPKAPDAESLELMADAAEQGFDALMSKGQINKPVRDKLVETFVRKDKKPVAYTLSKSMSATDQSFARATIEALKELPVIKMGVGTGVQQLAQTAHGDQAAQAKADADFIKERAAGVSATPAK